MSTLDVLREVYTNLSHQPPQKSNQEENLRSGQEERGENHTSSFNNLKEAARQMQSFKSEDKDYGKKRKKHNEDDEYLKWNEELMRHILPSEMEADFVAAVFEIGLRNSSPKVLMQLMPLTNQLTTEHIKSHLQKYRLHYSRSKEEFLQYYDSHLKRDFEEFVKQEGWRNTEALLARAQSSRENEEGEESDASEVPQENQSSLVASLDEVPIEVIQELNDKIVHEQMQLQATLQHHIMVQTRLQKAMHDQLKKLRTETAPGQAQGPPAGGPSGMHQHGGPGPSAAGMHQHQQAHHAAARQHHPHAQPHHQTGVQVEVAQGMGGGGHMGGGGDPSSAAQTHQHQQPTPGTHPDL